MFDFWFCLVWLGVWLPWLLLLDVDCALFEFSCWWVVLNRCCCLITGLICIDGLSLVVLIVSLWIKVG